MKVFSDGSAMWREWRTTGFSKRVYLGECVGSRSVGRPRKRWIDAVKDCLKKIGLDVRQARRVACMAGVREGECMGRSPGDDPLTLTRCYSCEMSQSFEALEEWQSVCGQTHNLRS